MAQQLAIHKWAEFFPLMEGEEFAELVTDIKEHGLVEPVVLYQGKVLDGRNRLRACAKAGVEPKFKEFHGHANGEDPALAYVISKNVRRRHLTSSQKGVLALELVPELEKQARSRRSTALPGTVGSPYPRARGKGLHEGETSNRAAQMLGIGRNTVDKAKRIAREAPAEIEHIRKGVKSISEVEGVISARKARDRAWSQTEVKHQSPVYDREVKAFIDSIAKFNDQVKEVSHPVVLKKFSPEAAKFVVRRLDTTIGLLEGLRRKLDG